MKAASCYAFGVVSLPGDLRRAEKKLPVYMAFWADEASRTNENGMHLCC